MSADQYRQTQSPDGKSKKARQSECEIKQRMTSHWDMDQLSREELEAEMAKGFRQDGTEPGSKPAQPVTPQEDTSDTDEEENPMRIGITLLIVAVVMMVGAVLLLQSAGN